MAADKSNRFDPYHKWLGIPPDQQPADHYRLLGVRPFEDDLEVIASAADRQMSHLKTFASGPSSEASQNLLNEVAQARLCLLNPHKKKQYDEQERIRLGSGKTWSQTISQDDIQQVDPASVPLPYHNVSVPPPLQPIEPASEFPEIRTEASTTKRLISSRRRSRALKSWLMLGISLVFMGLIVRELKLRYGGDPQVHAKLSVKSDAREAGVVDGVFLITLDRSRSIDTEIPYRIGGTADPNKDFEITEGFDKRSLVGNATIPAGQVLTTIRVKVVDDKLNEGSETLSLMLATPSEDSERLAVPSASQEITLTIHDDDKTHVAIKALQKRNAVGRVEGSFIVEQSCVSSADTIVAYDYEVDEEKLTISGNDHVPQSGTVKIAAGMTSATFQVPLIDDQLTDGPKRVAVKLRKVLSGHTNVSIDRHANRAVLSIREPPSTTPDLSPQRHPGNARKPPAEENDVAGKNAGQWATLDLSKKSQAVPLVDIERSGAVYPEVRIMELTGLATTYLLSPPAGLLVKKEEVFVQFASFPNARLRLSLDRLGSRIVMRIEPQMDLGTEDPIPFTSKKIAREALRTRQRADQFVARLANLQSEKASLEAWIKAPVIKSLQARGKAKLRVAQLKNEIKLMTSQKEDVHKQVQIVNNLEAFNSQLKKNVQLHFLIIEKDE